MILSLRKILSLKFFVNLITCNLFWASVVLLFFNSSTTIFCFSRSSLFLSNPFWFFLHLLEFFEFDFRLCDLYFRFWKMSWRRGMFEKVFWKTIFHRLYIIIMSHTTFRVNLHSIVCLNVKELFAWSRRNIWSVSDSNGIRTHNH